MLLHTMCQTAIAVYLLLVVLCSTSPWLILHHIDLAAVSQAVHLILACMLLLIIHLHTTCSLQQVFPNLQQPISLPPLHQHNLLLLSLTCQ